MRLGFYSDLLLMSSSRPTWSACMLRTDYIGNTGGILSHCILYIGEDV